MPFRHAHYFLILLLPLAALAFWRTYLSQFGASPASFHAHGVTATLWLLLLIAQSWSIHHGQRPLHRLLGMASLALFPLFMAGGIGIFLGMAQRFAANASPFYALYAPRLAWIDFVAVGGFAFFYYQALRLRRQVHAHSRYLLATVLFLLPPVLGRIAPALPPLAVHGPDEMWKLGIGFQLGNAVTALLGFALALRSGRHGRPFLLAALLTLLGALLYATIGGSALWRSLFLQAASLPVAPLAALAAAAGAVIGFMGWSAGRSPLAPRRAVPV